MLRREVSGGTIPAHTWISDSSLRTGDRACLCVSPPGCGTLLRWVELTNIALAAWSSSCPLPRVTFQGELQRPWFLLVTMGELMACSGH